MNIGKLNLNNERFKQGKDCRKFVLFCFFNEIAIMYLEKSLLAL